jgi:mannose-6-phosphate isomerase
MSELYPLKFEPILVDKLWGGTGLATRWGKSTDLTRKLGESWELSAVAENLSIVSNGFLAGNNIEEIIEVYMGDITGEAVFEKYGIEFPLLIKFIDAAEDLSIQVHPGDLLAKERHNAYGKTEMWYILENQPGAKIYTGFASKTSRELFGDALGAGTLPGMLNTEASRPGDVFFTPAGRIHAIGAGNLLVEIQQTSDITYRIFDWQRKNRDGTERELHNDLSPDAIDFSVSANTVIRKESVPDSTVNLVSCEYFVTNILHFNNIVQKDYNLFDSFIIYICLCGEFLIHWDTGTEIVKKGETVLLPAMITDVVLEPRPEAKLLEVFINSFSKKTQ